MQQGIRKSHCCLPAQGMPWFRREFSEDTYSVTVGLCSDQGRGNEDAGLIEMELWARLQGSVSTQDRVCKDCPAGTYSSVLVRHYSCYCVLRLLDFCSMRMFVVARETGIHHKLGLRSLHSGAFRARWTFHREAHLFPSRFPGSLLSRGKQRPESVPKWKVRGYVLAMTLARATNDFLQV